MMDNVMYVFSAFHTSHTLTWSSLIFHL